MNYHAYALSLILVSAALAASAQDVGTLDKATAEKVHATKPPYSPYANRNFPTRPLLRRHAPAHVLLDGRRRLRRAARSRARPTASPAASR